MSTASVSTNGDLPGDPRASALEVQDSICCERHILVLRGELDLSNASVLEGAIQRLCGNGAQRLLLDLDLAFMDSSGLRVVLAGRDLCQQSDCEFAVRLSSPIVRRLFEVAGVLNRLPVEPQEQTNP
jgi:anti-anti-sigma factor